MTAPERRRPLPALAFIGVLCLLTAIVWFRVIHRSDGSSTTATKPCSTTAVPPGSASPAAHTKSTEPHRPVAAPKVVPPPRKVSVLVLNSTSRNGIASATKKALTKQGFHVTDAKNDSSSLGGHGLIKGVAEIRYSAQALPAATLLRFYFPHAKMRSTGGSNQLVVVSLGKKYKSIATGKTVHKAMRAEHVHFGVPKTAPTKKKAC